MTYGEWRAIAIGISYKAEVVNVLTDEGEKFPAYYHLALRLEEWRTDVPYSWTVRLCEEEPALWLVMAFMVAELDNTPTL